MHVNGYTLGVFVHLLAFRIISEIHTETIQQDYNYFNRVYYYYYFYLLLQPTHCVDVIF